MSSEEIELAEVNALLIGAGCILLTLSGATAAYLSRSWIQSSFIYILLGAGCGGVLRALYGAGAQQQLASGLAFSDDFFFKVLLPLVVLDCGLNLKRENVDFYPNAMPIMLFTVFGTLVSGLAIGFGMWGIGAGMVGAGYTPLNGTLSFDDMFDSLKFGALISPTDPVAILSVLGSMGPLKDEQLYSIIFGESVLNDAIAIVMFQVFDTFTDTPGAAWLKLLKAAGSIVGIILGSTLLGVALGLLSARLTRWWVVSESSAHFEVAAVFFTCYVAYLLGDLLRLSGIFTLFACTLACSQYTMTNISPSAATTTDTGFKTVAWLAEAFIFFYLGVETPLAPLDGWDVPFILIVTALSFAGRGLVTSALAEMHNCAVPAERKIRVRSQMVMLVAGLRGGTAYALALGWNNDPERIDQIETLTMGIILISLCGVGSAAGGIISLLGLQKEGGGAGKVDEARALLLEAEAGRHWLARLDVRLKPHLTRYGQMPKIRRLSAPVLESPARRPSGDIAIQGASLRGGTPRPGTGPLPAVL